MKRDWTATLIIGSVILVVIPRWMPALMMSEGFAIPQEWLSWWRPMSAVFNGAMALVEAVAIAYVFSAWHKSEGQRAKRLMTMTVLMVVTFTLVLIPFAAGGIAQVGMEEVLSRPGQYVMALIWGTAVVLSTSVTVMAVGIAQKAGGDSQSKMLCWCGFAAESEDELADHVEIHYREVKTAENPQEALGWLESHYLDSHNRARAKLGLPSFPKLVDVVKIQRESGDESNVE